MTDDSGQAGAEIGITPQMVEAGVSVLADFRSIWDDAELALRVCTAMLAAAAGRGLDR